MSQEINEKFDKKLKELNSSLPQLKKGINCAELTLTSVLEILGIDNYLFHNLAIPLAAGFGGYKSEKGWQGACGAVCGACASIGVILGGQEKMDNDTMLMAMSKAAKFAKHFENKFGTIVCSELCGYDFSNPEVIEEYRENDIWAKICYNFIIWALDEIRRLTSGELKDKWE
ncbi:MAG: C-GCAxxG-C-C family protein [Candidatus Hermodarchaeota archaeon]